MKNNLDSYPDEKEYRQRWQVSMMHLPGEENKAKIQP